MSILTYSPGVPGPVVQPLSMEPGATSGLQVLVPVQVPGDGSGLSIGALLTPATGTILQFAVSGAAERLYVVAATSGVTVQVDVEALVLGLPVTPFTAVTLTEGDLYQFGPFRSVLGIPGTSTVQVVLSSAAYVGVLLTAF
jgi:hypothetical protein